MPLRFHLHGEIAKARLRMIVECSDGVENDWSSLFFRNVAAGGNSITGAK
jgi:hypothetical protein